MAIPIASGDDQSEQCGHDRVEQARTRRSRDLYPDEEHRRRDQEPLHLSSLGAVRPAPAPCQRCDGAGAADQEQRQAHVAEPPGALLRAAAGPMGWRAPARWRVAQGQTRTTRPAARSQGPPPRRPTASAATAGDRPGTAASRRSSAVTAPLRPSAAIPNPNPEPGTPDKPQNRQAAESPCPVHCQDQINRPLIPSSQP